MACQHCCQHKNLKMAGDVPHCQDCHKTWMEVPERRYSMGDFHKYDPKYLIKESVPATTGKPTVGWSRTMGLITSDTGTTV